MVEGGAVPNHDDLPLSTIADNLKRLLDALAYRTGDGGVVGDTAAGVRNATERPDITKTGKVERFDECNEYL